MLPLTIDGRPFDIDQQEKELPETDLLSWLEHHPLYPKVFWKERGSQITRAAVGSLLTFPNLPTFPTDSPLDLRFYGGLRFNPAATAQRDLIWRDFPACSFWLPQVELSQQPSGTKALLYSQGKKSAADQLEMIGFKENSCPPTWNRLLERRESPDFATWKTTLGTLLDTIASGQLTKVVTARRTSLTFSQPLSPWPILAHLRARAQNATLFAFQLSPHLCFLGATPERLFSREGSLLHTEAVAATRPRGRTPTEDGELEKELLCSDKDQREFGIVREFLTSSLSPLSREILWDGPDRILKGSHVQHLYNRMTARLNNTISDADLIARLHPTPALGGYPRTAAMECLAQLEPFDRGWYGAPLGVISPGQSSLYVAIRSGLICQNTLHLFAGTGIVLGSTAEKEWEELEQKIRPFMELWDQPSFSEMRNRVVEHV